MDAQSPILAIVPDESDREQANDIAAALGYTHANVVVGGPATAAAWLQQQRFIPRYILISIGNRSHDILPEIDLLAMQCEAGTRVVVVGETNDIVFYRALIDRGVAEYFAHVATVDELRAALFSTGESAGAGEVIAFIGASASDGSSTLALNTAYSLSSDRGKKVVLVDLDYQYGMVAKHLDLSPQYGIKELFEHPERGIDDTLVARMTFSYKNKLDIIAAPATLQFLPAIPPEIVRDLIGSLQRKYDFVVLDVPHVWTNWVSTSLSCSKHIVLVSQLWLKSITHAARLLASWQRLGIDEKHIISVVNRSGSKFKEAINAKDFERVCGRAIDVYVPNDIKMIVRAENEGTTLIELGDSSLTTEIRRLADKIAGRDETAAAGNKKKRRWK